MGFPLTITDLAWAFESGQSPFINIPSLQVHAGQTVCLGGPSGSGKTTLLFLLAGLEKPHQGCIAWDGQAVSQLSEVERDRFRRRNIGMVFQDFHLIPELSVIENLWLPTRFEHWQPLPAQRRRASELLHRVGLAKPQQRTATLSRGEMQRLAVARALLFKPAILIADEPTASLDATNEATIADLLFELAREEAATLFLSTHQPGLKERANLVIELSHGRISAATALEPKP